MNDIDRQWDLVIVGGGITGAGVLLAAALQGTRALLVEQLDFAFGTSSRSSKLIHGGLRYLRQGRIGLIRTAVKERQRLLHSFAGLVTPLDFLLPIYRGQTTGRLSLSMALSLYDAIARRKGHHYLKPGQMLARHPWLRRQGLAGGFVFQDAQTDDARLVLRLIQAARRRGGRALNYTRMLQVQRNRRGRVVGATVGDVDTGATIELHTGCIINATGAWAGNLHPSIAGRMRPLKGSHLVLPSSVLSLSHAVSFHHPQDDRPMFLLPWEGAILLGTTDVDYAPGPVVEPAISRSEAEYLMDGLAHAAPRLGLSPRKIVCSFSGIRPVVGTASGRPSDASREHWIWSERGLVTVAGGKLTTFRVVAAKALKAAHPFLPHRTPAGRGTDRRRRPAAETSPPPRGLTPLSWRRLVGRYGPDAPKVVDLAPDWTLTPIADTCSLWAELPYAAACEDVRHLTDLLLRRVRVGLLLPDGAQRYMDTVEQLCRPVMPWSEQDWGRERRRYRSYWQQHHAVEGAGS